MACRWIRASALALSIALGGLGTGSAQTRVLVTDVAYESPDLVVPVALLSLVSDARTWTLGLVGSTATIAGTHSLSPGRSLLLQAEVTPFNANASHYLYRDGVRDDSLSFRDASATVSAGYRFAGEHRYADLRVIGRYESVGELPDSVLRRWRYPFLGVGARIGVESVASDDVFRARWDGVKASADGTAFFGSQAWWRLILAVGAGKRVGAVFARANAALFLSGNTDVVSRYLVGGSWDVPEGLPLYGHRYAEFRVDRGMLFGGGADVSLVRNLDLGFRVGHLESPSHVSDGAAVRLATVWNGLTFHLGAGGSLRGVLRGPWTDTVVFGGVTAAALF